MLCADYLRAERPTFESCFRRMRSAAKVEVWPVPSSRTLERRLNAEFSAVEQKLARHGLDAVKEMYPAQQRDRSVFHALEAVNADGHKFDVWVEFPDGDVIRPMMAGLVNQIILLPLIGMMVLVGFRWTLGIRRRLDDPGGFSRGHHLKPVKHPGRDNQLRRRVLRVAR